MSPQGVMTRKKTSYNPGLNPVKGQKFSPGTQTGSRGFQEVKVPRFHDNGRGWW